jgi:hypothetical protein
VPPAALGWVGLASRGHATPRKRISALEIEKRVSAAAQVVLGDRPAIALALEASGIDLNRLPSVLKSARAWVERLASKGESAAALGELIERVQLSRESLSL